jgi:hypothetical protein
VHARTTCGLCYVILFVVTWALSNSDRIPIPNPYMLSASESGNDTACCAIFNGVMVDSLHRSIRRDCTDSFTSRVRVPRHAFPVPDPNVTRRAHDENPTALAQVHNENRVERHHKKQTKPVGHHQCGDGRPRFKAGSYSFRLGIVGRHPNPKNL